ncbi:hypothetical protein SKAU_G00017200 [Synaphobranchus kaupii]|uniref:Gypsy retrotransposon integrase-like protein 1 n=1 Tax=Synaphobranchus kaupii TaxID=118154 RepID=A0A9Q1GCZ1_SYNKA|nr:hypothetical protein SKAU_G00017200 [Synaphobranchus kaupii]
MEHEQDEHSDCESDDEDTVHVLSVMDSDDGYWVTPLLENTAVWMQVDTGTRVSMVSEAVYKEKLQHLTLRVTKLKLRTYTGEAVPVLGVVDVTVEHNEQKKTLPLYIIQGNCPALLGHRWLEKLRLNWQEVFLVNDGDTGPLQEILKKHSKVFDGELSTMKDITVKLTVKPGSTPKCLKARPVLYAIKPKVEAELDRLVKSGVVEPERLTIVTHRGLYRYRRLPFGITSAPALFQRAMDQILSGLPGVQCYLDDLLITGPDEQSHLRNLEATLQRLEEYGLRVRKDKCEFFKPSVEYLGHVIHSTGLHKALPKVKAIVEAPSPKNYDIKHRNADQPWNADGLSRLPLPVAHTEPTRAKIFYFKEVTAAPVTSTHVKKHTHTDPVMSEVMDIVARERRGEMTASLKPYLVRRNELSVQSGCLLWGYHVIIPLPLREKVLDELHSGHCGVVQMKEIARSYFWWPCLDAAIEEKAKSCSACQKLRNLPQLAPLHPWDWPEGPWQRVHIDFAGPLENHMILVVVDAHSKWPEVAVMKSTSSERTIEELPSIFSRFGLPQWLVSDNSPQLVSEEFKTFMEENGIQHIKSAPYHLATNGLAERFVQTMKQALKSSQSTQSLNRRLSAFLLSYRNTPHATTKVSPASAMFKRQLRTRLDLLRPQKTREVVHLQQRAQVERRAKTKFRSFIAGDRVLARNYTKGVKWTPVTVVAKTGPVSYTVETSNHLIWRRHIDQLLHTCGSRDDPPQPTSLVPELETYQEQHPSPEEPQKEPSGMDTVPGTPRPAQVPTPGITSPRPGLLQSSPRDNVTGLPTGRTNPRRDRQPPDRP